MSLRVVLDGDTLMDALTQDTENVLQTLVRICDHVVLNELVQREYSRNKALLKVLPELEKLRELKPKPKVMEAYKGPKPSVSTPRGHHTDLFAGAVWAQANILITHIKLRGKWSNLAQTLQAQYQLQVLSPGQYLSERGRTS